MKQNKNNIRKITLLAGLALAGFTTFKCNAYDLMGQMYPTIEEPKKLEVFVTSLVTMGDMSFNNNATIIAACPSLSGVSKANCVCKLLASNAGLKSSNGFSAWLSDSNTDAACNIIGRIGNKLISNSCSGYKPGNVSYVDINGNLIFNSWDEIVSGSFPKRNINITESNGPAPVHANYGSLVWTGTTNGGIFSGTAATTTCTDWGTVGSGIVGNFSILASWTNTNVVPITACGGTQTFPIYCFEQP